MISLKYKQLYRKDVEEQMKTKIKYKSKYLCDIKNILMRHIQLNLKDYLILSIFFIIGVMVGVVLINNSDEQSKVEISGYINGFVEIIKSDTYKIDKIQLVKISIWENLKLVLLIWIAGSTIIGIPLIYIITGYKGFCIGYTISAIITSLGVGRRNCVFNISIIFAECNSDTSDFNA